MKTKVCASLLVACLPWLAMAQNDDLYFVPTETGTQAVTKQTTETSTAYSFSPASTVVVKDVDGNVRDIDEYNRRYTSRDNTFSVQNDTLYIAEKPYGERGEWINGFDGSQADYEYAMRIIRFRSPAYAIPVSSPFYWDVVYSLPSWDWNIYEDGIYAYVFPTYTNPWWWDWWWYWGISGPRWYWGWYSPWYYGSWYWSGYWGPWHHHHYAWGGAGWRHRGYADFRPTRYQASIGSFTRGSERHAASTSRIQQGNVVRSRGESATRRASIGRVVQGSAGTRGESQSVRPGRTAVRGTSTGTVRSGSRSQGIYTRPSIGTDRTGSSYNRPSSTRSSNVVGYGNSNNNNNRSSYSNSYQRSNTYNRSSGSSSYTRSSGSGVSRSSGGGGTTRSSGGGGRSR